MITYKIDGINSTFQSKTEKFVKDVNRILFQNDLPLWTEVKLLSYDDIPESNLNLTSNGNANQFKTLSEGVGNPEHSNNAELATETADLQSVHDRVDKFDLSDDDSITEWNGVPNDNTDESN
jgi:hypothetical protein